MFLYYANEESDDVIGGSINPFSAKGVPFDE